MPRTLASLPDGVTEEPIWIQVHQMPALEPDADGYYHSDGSYDIDEAVLGVPHLFVDDIDVTYLRDTPARIKEWALEEPGGETYALVEFPQMYPFDTVGEVGFELGNIGSDRNCDIVIVEEGVTPGVYDGTQHEVWNGILVSDEPYLDEDTSTSDWHAKGLLIGQAMSQQHNPPNYLDPTTDIGTLIPALLNGLTSRRFNEIEPVVTGIPVGPERGAESDKVWDYVQQVLSRAWTVDGQQWTIARTGPKTYEMVLKDNTTIHYEIETGTPGVSASLSRDSSQKYTTIWGRGVGPDGYSWRGMHYPDFVLGSFDSSYLTGIYRRPLIWDPKVSDGRWEDDGLPAAEYNPDVEPEEVEINFPVGITKDEAYISAGKQLARDENPGVTGVITLRTDPKIPAEDVAVANSRFLIPAGRNLSYRNFRGGDFSTDFEPFLLRLSQVRVNLQQLTVQLTVDSRQRDAMTLASIIDRDRDAAVDPARRPGAVNRRSRQEPDVAFEYDGEANINISEHPVTGGAWNVYPFPLSQVGRIVAITMRCTSRAAYVLFGAEVDAAFLDDKIGDPLASDDPLAPNIEDLEDAGLIEGWGKLGNACGYYPGQEANGDSFQGLFKDTNTIEYVSALPPWIWVCEWAEDDANISGEIYPAANT